MKLSSRIPMIDGLRAISILFVVISHLVGLLGHHYRNVVAQRLLSLFSLGHFGVTVFFVISGFLITTLLLNELDESGTIRLVRFYFRRTLRIFLPFYVLLAATFALRTFGLCHLSTHNFVAAATYTMNYLGEATRDLDFLSHSWSLCVEEHFYILWPAALLLLGRSKGMKLAASFLVICPALRLWGWHTLHSTTFFQSHYVADSLACGALLAGMREWLHGNSLYNRFLHSKFCMFLPFLAIGIALLASHPSLFPYAYVTVGISVMNLGITITLDWVLSKPTAFASRLLLAPALQWIGLASYSVYLWQQMFTDTPLLSRVGGVWPQVLLAFAATVATASVSYYLVEQNAMKLRHCLEPRLLGQKERPVVSAAAAN
jgi:peptidoglycan/LPS O-acetylase OafA/YrhL